MWTYKHQTSVNAAPAAVWSLYANVAVWPKWDDAMERVDIDGDFVVDTTGTMHIKDIGPVPFRLTAVDVDRRFASESPFNRLTVTFDHLIEPTDRGCLVSHLVTIDGPNIDQIGPIMGPNITNDVPHAMAAIARLAEASEV
jgi:Polyketide cyclase / dehydrase and lipid transport